jgi:Plavaka transposase
MTRYLCIQKLVRQGCHRTNDSILTQPAAEVTDITADDSHMSMMDRRRLAGKRKTQLPRRFRDEIPQPPTPLPLANTIQPIGSPEIDLASMDTEQVLAASASSTSAPSQIIGRLRRAFRTPPNIFGLFRSYDGKAPAYDPEEQVSFHDLSNVPECTEPTEGQTLYPFPNRTSFRLAEWHWNGVQKSQASFRELIDIISDPEFRSEDVRDVNWDHIHSKLGTDESDSEWLDEDSGWTRTPVTISVPHQSRRGVHSVPGVGPRNYTVNDFYHRSLVSVIREKITGLGERHQFHFEPYELHWQRVNLVDPVRVQGELYTSPAFVDANRELQDLPGEPGCDLPRVIAALMFWSDATQLTAFGNAKLWPLYMFFGNESKYRRCKPTCHLCEHIAYFQTVSMNSVD